MLHTIIFIGRSGSGKGTQARLVMDYIRKSEPDLPTGGQILYVETGEHFRRFIRGESFSSKISRAVNQKDERQPDFLACFMWGNMLIEELEENMHLVFDGAPRSLDEAHVLTSALNFYRREKPHVIYLNVSRGWSEKHLLSRGRPDDANLSRIDKRLDWFDQDVLPAIEYFKKNKNYLFIEVDGEQKVEKVHSDIVSLYDKT